MIPFHDYEYLPETSEALVAWRQVNTAKPGEYFDLLARLAIIQTAV
jgi:hypothetical protein